LVFATAVVAVTIPVATEALNVRRLIGSINTPSNKISVHFCLDAQF
jgi:hypothetical protein